MAPSRTKPDRLTPRDAAIAVVTRLRGAGHAAYLAGGCVRDELLGVTPKDYDVATDARPDAIRVLFERTAEVGASFGVMLVREFGATTEVATFRSDGPYTDKRRPDHVEFADARADAQRRDFTINALFIDPLIEGDDRIIDFVGGRADVDARVLRAVGDPAARLAEDHLRALRAVRFAARYALTIDERTADAIREHAAALTGVSVERIGEEVRRMMGDPSRARAAGLIESLGLDRPIFGAPRGTSGSASAGALARVGVGADVALALAAWAVDRAGSVPDPGETARAWRGALDLSNDLADDLRRTLDGARAFMDAWDALGVAGCKRLASRARAGEALDLVGAIDADRRASIDDDVRALEADAVGLAPEPLVDGDLLVACGFRPGKGFGDLLDAVYDAQLEGLVATRDGALRLAEELASSHGVERTGA